MLRIVWTKSYPNEWPDPNLVAPCFVNIFFDPFSPFGPRSVPRLCLSFLLAFSLLDEKEKLIYPVSTMALCLTNSTNSIRWRDEGPENNSKRGVEPKFARTTTTTIPRLQQTPEDMNFHIAFTISLWLSALTR